MNAVQEIYNIPFITNQSPIQTCPYPGINICFDKWGLQSIEEVKLGDIREFDIADNNF